MNMITPVLQALLGTALLLSAIAATLRPRWLAPLAAAMPQQRAARIATAALFWLAACATLAGMLVPFAAFFSACLALAASVLLAVRLRRTARPHSGAAPVLMALAAVAIALGQPLGLKVMALPKADELAFEPAASEVLRTYEAGLALEGIAAGADGTLYLAANRGLDFSHSDYYSQAQGELIVRKNDGAEAVLFKTPRGSTAGVVVAAPDGSVYMTSHGEVSRIWRIDAQGQGKQVAQFPRGAWPNGLDLGPDGMLYTPDSALGVIWRVNPADGRSDAVLRDAALLARPYIALAPGANGLHFSDRSMLVTVSDRGTVLKYEMDMNGHFGPPAVVASGIPGDDFAVGSDGSLFITTHPYDTLVRVRPDGRRAVIGKAAQQIVGATDAAFGKGAQDQQTLYVVTDGGAFTAGAKARGQLIAVRPYARPQL